MAAKICSVCALRCSGRCVHCGKAGHSDGQLCQPCAKQKSCCVCGKNQSSSVIARECYDCHLNKKCVECNVIHNIQPWSSKGGGDQKDPHAPLTPYQDWGQK